MKKTHDELVERYIRKYEELKMDSFKELNLESDELIVHGSDIEDRKFYKVSWAVTNKGRVWSLSRNRWMYPWLNGKYWRVANTYVHLLVNYYFITDEERKIKKYAEEHKKKYEVHHLDEVEALDLSVMTKEERIEACMKVNRKSNLMLQIERDHDDAHKLKKGKRKLGKDKEGYERVAKFDSMTSIMIASNASVYFSYNENGKKELNTKLILPTLTPEEEKELDEKISYKFLLW